MQIRHGGSNGAVALTLMFVMFGMSLLVPLTANAFIVTVTVQTYPRGGFSDFNLITNFPVTVTFAVHHPITGAVYNWQFGDGANSTQSNPIHTYQTACVYDIEVQMTDPNGTVTSGGLVFGAFVAKGHPGAVALCPPKGTGGFTSVDLAGGFYVPSATVMVTLDGTNIGTVTADRGGDWVMNVTGDFPPEPNDTQLTFTTSPSSQNATFTTVEGISASPSSGSPGGSVVVSGRSYPAGTDVSVDLGGVSLGTVLTDNNGSFQQSFAVPYDAPLTAAGTYPYATFPQILGSQANFTSTGGTQITNILSSDWSLLLLLILILLMLILIYIYVRRRRKRGPAEE